MLGPKRVRQTVTVKLGVGADASGLPERSKDAAALATSFPEPGIMVVAPSDPPKLLDAHRLASRGENRERMWRVLGEHPRFEHDPPQKPQAIAEINRVAGEETREGIFWALGLLLLITGNAELRPTLEPQLDALWTSIPQLTMWLVTAEEAFVSRVRLSQLLFQFQHTPDLDIETLMADERRSMVAQSLSNGLSTADLVQPIFLTFSPAATGFAAPWVPHTIALDFGAAVDLRVKPPASLSAVYDPRVLSAPVNLDGREAWFNSIPKEQLATLFQWWISRLNLLYGIITDPTRFPNKHGEYDSSDHLAFRLTVERVLADLRIINASPQSPALTRLGATFDLLDKLETLLGYGPQSLSQFGKAWGPGRGFAKLLDRRMTLPMMQRSFDNMPRTLQSMFKDRAEVLFDAVYAEVADGVLRGRLDKDGVRCGSTSSRKMSWDNYVGTLVRAVRNSSHGLLQARKTEADVAATHTGALPDTLPELVPLIALALLADPERLWSMEVWG
jgi:hypothetical protein